MKFKGYIQVYTGNGKGKTTASLGLALRAAGRGLNVFMAQFMKKGEYGELKIVEEKLSDFITIEQYGLPDFHYSSKGVQQKEIDAALEGIKAVNDAIESRKYNIVIMDEINVLLYFKIIDIDLVLDILDNKPEDLELILTGRYAPEEILKRADLITEMKDIKHYFDNKVAAREGIEF